MSRYPPARHLGPLGDINIKVERAKKHIEDLDVAIKAFLDTEPYRAIKKHDPKTGDDVYIVNVIHRVPRMLGAVVGDAVHNLRSALDLLACQLVRAGGGRITRATGFPIGDDAQEFESGLSKKAKGISVAAAEALRRLKPYKGGGDGLWRLHRLDILDKHRLLIPVGAAHRQFLMTGTVTAEELSAPFTFAPIAVRNPTPVFPLEDGAEILRIAAATDGEREKFQFDADYQPTFEVAFGQGQIFEGEAIVPALNQLLALVRMVVAVMGRHVLNPTV